MTDKTEASIQPADRAHRDLNGGHHYILTMHVKLTGHCP